MKRKNFTFQNFLSACLMIMLMGFSYSANAQCDITSGNLIGSTTAPDGTTVDLTDVDLDLSNAIPGGGEAYLNAFFLSNTANINGSDPGVPAVCDYYFIYNGTGTLIGTAFPGLGIFPAGGTEITFDCSDIDGSPTEAKGEIYFIKVNSNVDDPNAGLAGSPSGSSYAAVRINSIEDNHGPSIEAPVDVTIDCADAFDPEGIWDIAVAGGYPSVTFPAPYDVDPTYPALVLYTVPVGFPAWYAGAEDNCSIKDITYADAYLFNDPAVCYKIERTWTAEDVFGNKSTDVQYISVLDTEFPRFTTATNSDLDQCEFQNEYDMLMEACDTPVAFNPTVEDNCSVAPQVSLVDEFRYEEYDLVFFLPTMMFPGDRGKYDYTLVQLYKVEDDCGNEIYRTRHVTKRDTMSPVISTIQGIATSLNTNGAWAGMATYPIAGPLPPSCGLPGPNTWFTGPDPAPYYTTSNWIDYTGGIGPYPPYERFRGLADPLPGYDFASAFGISTLTTYPPFWETTKNDKDVYGVASGSKITVNATASTAGCMPELTVNLGVDDCAPNSELNTSWKLTNTTTLVVTSGFVSGTIINFIDLEQGTTYTLEANVFDPSGNSSCVTIPIEVSVVAPNINCELVESVGLNSSGTYDLTWPDVDDGSYDPCDGFAGATPGIFAQTGLVEYAIRKYDPVGGHGPWVRDLTPTPVGPYPILTLDCDDLFTKVGNVSIQLRVTNDRGAHNYCIKEVKVEEGALNFAGSATATDESVVGASDGTVTATVSATAGGGGGPYSYHLVGGSTNATGVFTGLAAGTYTVEITDANGCTIEVMATVALAPPPLCITLGDVSGAVGSTQMLEVRVDNFLDVVSFDFDVVLTAGTTIPSGASLQMINAALAGTGSLGLTPASGHITYFCSTCAAVGIDVTPNGSLLFKIPIVLGPVAGSGTSSGTGLFAAAFTHGPLGNATIKPGTITITTAPPMRVVEGTISHWNGCNVPNADVAVAGGLPTPVTTNTGGVYSTVVPDGTATTITPSKGDYRAGGQVNTADAMLAFQYALDGTGLTANPAKQVAAADVDDSGSVNGYDAFLINQIAMNNLGALPAGSKPSWVFDPTSISYTAFGDVTTNDFDGNKIADVDGSYCNSPSLTGESTGTKTRSGLTTYLSVDDVELKASNTYTIDFKAKDFDQLGALQIEFDFDQSALEFVEFVPGNLANLSVGNYNPELVKEGKFLMGWFNYPGSSLADDEVVFSLTFNAKADVAKISELFTIETEYFLPYGFQEDGASVDLEISYNDVATPQAAAFELMQNKPNPFNGSTLISFNLPEASKATLTVMDISGRVLRVIEDNFVKGYNEIQLERADLGTSGVMYYQLATETNTAVKRMVILD